MKAKVFLAVLAVCLLGGYGSAQANILYYCDYNVGLNPFPQAMTELGLAYTAASSDSDFNTQLGSGSWDAAVLLLQNYSHGSSEYSNLSSYLSGGGRAIFADWYRDATLGSLFGINYTGSNNQNPVTLTAAFLQNGIGSTLNLYDPGWGTWSMGMSLNGAQAGAYFPNGNTAIAYTDNTIINGMLKDTFLTYSDGLQLAKNELNYITQDVIPEPATILLLGSALSGLAGLKFKRKFVSRSV